MLHTYSATHLLSVGDLDRSEFMQLLNAGSRMRSTSQAASVLSSRTIVLLFEKPSLRTRVTFEVAVRRLGGWPVLLNGESRLGERESVADVARNLSLWVDGIVARVFSHQALRELAEHSSVPVINALSDFEHPCQAVADILTLHDTWETFAGRTVVYVGDWNNVSRSLWRACELAGIGFRAVTPRQYGPLPDEKVDWTADLAGVKGADAIYTDTWASMGEEQELQERLSIFERYQVNDELLARTGKPTLFMHCLPAHRGLEVTDAVIDSPRSLVLQQAANRLPAEMAILKNIFGA